MARSQLLMLKTPENKRNILMPIYKESKYQSLKPFLIMTNLDDFKVEELEQRLEMAKWSASASASSSGTVTGTVTVQF